MLSYRSPLLGESPQIKAVFATIAKIAQTDSTVLITGESGTGKELVARAIYDASPRAGKAFVVVNCGAIPAELLEAELFGHVRGAFTGATQNRQGRFEAAHGGVIFLDEIGEMPVQLQVKLLRAIQTRRFEPVGSSRTVEVDVRIIAATNRDLEEQIRLKQFREDLYYRLNVIPVAMPALRERKGDIPLLVNHFVQQFNTRNGHSVEPPTGEILEALLAYDWPGNVRELENLMERIVILKGQGQVDTADLPHKMYENFADSKGSATTMGVAASGDAYPKMILPTEGLDLKEVVTAFENHLVDQALARTNGNKNRASELLRMNRTTLVEKLRKRGMIVTVAEREAQRERELIAKKQQGPTGASTGINGGNNGSNNGGNNNIDIGEISISPNNGKLPESNA